MAANGETYIVYGDLMLWNCLTPPGGFHQEAVFDETNTDLLYHKFTIKVIGWVTNISKFTASIGSLPNNGQTSAGLRQAGMQYTVAPRQHFEYHTGAQVFGDGSIGDPGATLLKCDPFTQQAQVNNPGNYDLNNGPKCTHFSITQVTADSLFQVEASFEVCALVCGTTGNNPNNTGILDNRWSVEDVVDLNRMTTRTINGRLRLMSSIVNPNTFRSAVILGLQPGFRRETVNIAVTPDGLMLIYTVVDIEIAYSAPSPATSWSFEHTESSTREGGIAKFGEVRVTLRGDRYVDHKKLMSVAASICQAKLTAGAANNKSFIMSVSITDSYGDDDNSVTMIARGQRFPKADSLLGLPTPLLGVPISPNDLLNSSPNYDPRLSRGARKGDSIELSGPIPIAQALSSYLQTPCGPYHTISKGIAVTSASGTQSNSPQVSLSLVQPQDIPDDSSNSYFNNSANTSIYTYYQMQSSYEMTSMRAHCPVAGPSSLGSSGSGSNNNGYGNPPTGNSQDTSVVVNLASKMCKRHVRIRGERVGAWPDVPVMQDTYQDNNSPNITYTLLSATDLPQQPTYSPDGKQIYTFDREYVYAMSRAPTSTDKLTVGVNPYDLAKPVIKYYDNGQPESSYPLS